MKKIENKEFKYFEITPAKGMVLTAWNKVEGDKRKYTSATQMVCPLDYDFSTIYEISVEEDATLRAEREELVKKEREARKTERMAGRKATNKKENKKEVK